MFWKRQLPLIIVLVGGITFIFQYYVPHQASQDLYQWYLDWAMVMGVFASIMGFFSIIKLHATKVSKKAPGWYFSVITLCCMLLMVLGAVFTGKEEDSLFMQLYKYVQVPIEATVFSLLAFYISSAAYRAFRAKSAQATALLIAAIIVMLGRVPIGEYISFWKPWGIPTLTDISDWLLNVPNMAAKRAITIGVALGMMVMSLKIILGIERSYLGGDLRRFLGKITNLNRRVIYIIIFLAISIPLFFPMGLPVPISTEVKSVYDYIKNLGPSDAVLISADYDASTLAELQPMMEAVMKHCFKGNVKLLIMSAYPVGTGLAQISLNRVLKEYEMKNGIDYVFLGYKPNFYIVIQQIGADITQAFPTDYYGTPMKDLPMMENIHNFKDIDLSISFSGTGIGLSWLFYAHERFNEPLALGVTGVMAPDYFPYLQSGQFVGLVGGMKGAAEYETLIREPALANAGMDAQSWSHICIILFIIIGNIGYFATGKKRKFK